MRPFLIIACVFASSVSAAAASDTPPPTFSPIPPVATFSIVAYDKEAGEWGVAVQSKFIAVGSVVPWAKAGVGAIATQSWANTTYGPRGLAMLTEGASAEDVMKRLTDSDKQSDRRQVGIVDAQGRAATFTGDGCNDWAGGKTGGGYCVQGNILAGPGVVDAMADTYEHAAGDLGDRLIAALRAGQDAGGDKRGRQSAALLIVREDAGYSAFNDRYRDLRVDDHPTPIQELARVYAIHKSVFPPPNGTQAARRLGQRLTQLFFQGKSDDLWERCTPPMRKVFGEPAKIVNFRDTITAQFGEVSETLNERAANAGALRTYQRHVRFSKSPIVMEIQWAIDAQNHVAGFYVKPAPKPAPTEHLDYETQTTLRLPFDGPWTVGWGGRAIQDNYHAIAPDQRFAYDILIARSGSTHREPGPGGPVNEDYYCFDLPVLAPGPGTIVAAGDGLPDNTPGQMDPEHPMGNHVIIDHHNGEFSFLAHLKNGSLAVKVGDKVGPGDRIGRCGNSGNTSEPHIHYHLQNTPTFSQGEGLPAPFRNYLTNGLPTPSGEPTRGQIIQHHPTQ